MRLMWTLFRAAKAGDAAAADKMVELVSHVTHHTSHVTRHTSHVTRHTAHVTRHTSHVTTATLYLHASGDVQRRLVVVIDHIGVAASLQQLSDV